MKITSKAMHLFTALLSSHMLKIKDYLSTFLQKIDDCFKQQVILFFILSGNQKSFCLKEFFRIREHEKPLTTDYLYLSI